MSGDKIKQVVTIRVGVEQELAKKIVKLLKDSKLKVQGSIQGDTVRVSGTKKDFLQEAIALVRKSITDFPPSVQQFSGLTIPRCHRLPEQEPRCAISGGWSSRQADTAACNGSCTNALSRILPEPSLRTRRKSSRAAVVFPWADAHGFKYTARADFDARVVVLARANYSVGEFDGFSLTDLAVAWGALLGPVDLRAIQVQRDGLAAGGPLRFS